MKTTEPIFNPYNYFASEGEKGMTSTSANKLANLAKERNREDMLMVESVRFYSDVMTLLVNPSEKVVLTEGRSGTAEEFEKIREALLRVARFNAFVAWVREAITAKDQLINKTSAMSLKDWCDSRGITMPEEPDNDVEREAQEQRAAGKADIDEMARYFINQSKAAALGQAIHPDGPIDQARRALIDSSFTPSRKEGSGKDIVIITRKPTATTQDVTNFYMSLQSDWRHSESAVNEAKSKWNTADSELFIELANDYNAKRRDYDNEMTRIRAEWDKWRLEETRRIGKLKIRIPSALQPVLDELLALGKENIE